MIRDRYPIDYSIIYTVTRRNTAVYYSFLQRYKKKKKPYINYLSITLSIYSRCRRGFREISIILVVRNDGRGREWTGVGESVGKLISRDTKKCSRVNIYRGRVF